MMVTPPPEVLEAARVVDRWAAENNIKSWKIGALASRDELKRSAARYAIAREMGTEVMVERWAGWRRQFISREEYDELVDRKIAASKLSFGEVVDQARKILGHAQPT